jgi:PAS domain S-box-containing protein
MEGNARGGSSGATRIGAVLARGIPGRGKSLTNADTVEKLPRGRAIVLLRFTLIVATAYLLLVEHEFSALPVGLIALIVAALASNVAMTRLPARVLNSTTFHCGVIIGDTLWVTAALLTSGLFRADFFYLYFLVLLLAAIGESLGLIAIGTIVVCAAYLIALSATGGTTPFWSSRLLIRVPFLLTAAAFYGYLVDRLRREQQRAREESRAVARLEEIQRTLAGHAQDVERANDELAREITERRRAEEALHAAKDYAENLINSSLDMIVSVDADRHIVEFNRAAEEAFDYSKGEVLGTPIDCLYADPATGGQVHQAILRYGRYAGTVTNKRKSGDIFYSYLSAAVLRDENGTIVGSMGISRDITEHRRAEEALRESNRRLEEALAELQATQQQVLQQERLRALGQMASGIAHDFNNALSPVLGFTEILLDHPGHLDDRPKVLHYLHMIHTAAKDAASIVRRLREFYRPREGNEVFLPVSLNHLAEQVIMLTQPRWKDQAQATGATIRIATAFEMVPLVAGNEAELREVLTNLILNSVDALPEGGTITLRTRADGTSVLLEVRDTGIGMSDEVRAQCLEPFFSTKGERGTGLGLAMVYGIIQRHRGSLHIDSAAGQGTSVTVRLPAQAAPEVQKADRGAPPSLRRLHVLVVDDDPPIREMLTAILAGDGHTVETACNGREGLAKFHAGWFDVVVTDRGMPEMSGDQLATAIKRLTPLKPVILLTGFGDLLIASGEKPVDVDIILSKPVTAVELRTALTKVAA